MSDVFTKIKWGDGITVTDQGAGVIRVDTGGKVQPLAPTFHDANDDEFLQDRWTLTTTIIRNALYDTSSAGPWTHITSTAIGSSLTVSATNEMVFAFTIKSYIRSLTSNSPFTDLWQNAVPDIASGPQTFAANAEAQTGTVTYSANAHPNDVTTGEKYQVCMIGFKPHGGTPVIHPFPHGGSGEFGTTQVDLNPNVSGLIPSTSGTDPVLPGDILMLHMTMRNSHTPPDITLPYQEDWTLARRSPDRAPGGSLDPNWVGVEQFIYLMTWPA